MNPTSVKMMDYFARKAKRLQAIRHGGEGEQRPVLGEDNADFLTKVISAEAAPPLPKRPLGPTAGDYEDNILQLVLYDSNEAQENLSKAETAESVDKKGTGKEKEKKKDAVPKLTPEEMADLERLVDEVKEQTRDKDKDRGKGKEKEKSKDKEKEKHSKKEKSEDKKASRLTSMFSKKDKDKDKQTSRPSTPDDEAKETEELNKVLEDLDLASAGTRAFSFTRHSQELIEEFTLILKDLMNGVPTAYDDLTHLLEDQDNDLNRQYKKLPTFLQKLIAGVPKKVTNQAFGAVNAAQTSVGAKASDSSAGVMGIAQSFLTFATLKELVTNPKGVKGMLATIMSALKMRWPAFLGTNILLSLGVFILLFVFWYCHKRGRQVRLGNEQKLILDSEGNPIQAIEGAETPEEAKSDLSSRTSSRSYFTRSYSSRSDRSRNRSPEYTPRSDRSRERARGSETMSGALVVHGPSVGDKREKRETRERQRRSSLSETSSESEREREMRRARRRERRRREREKERERMMKEDEERSGTKRDDRDKERDRDRDRDRDLDREKRKTRDRDHERHGGSSKHEDRNRRREKRSERDKDGDRDRDYDKDKDRDRERRREKKSGEKKERRRDDDRK